MAGNFFCRRDRIWQICASGGDISARKKVGEIGLWVCEAVDLLQKFGDVVFEWALLHKFCEGFI